MYVVTACTILYYIGCCGEVVPDGRVSGRVQGPMREGLPYLRWKGRQWSQVLQLISIFTKPVIVIS